MSDERQTLPSPDTGEGHRSWLDIAVGVGFALCGAVYFNAAQGFQPMMPNSIVGPGLLPLIGAIVFIVFGIALAFTGFVKRPLQESGSDTEMETGTMPFMVILIGGLIGVVLAMPLAGFVPTAALFAFVATWASGARWWGALISAVVLTAAVYALFSNVLRVPLPVGPFF